MTSSDPIIQQLSLALCAGNISLHNSLFPPSSSNIQDTDSSRGKICARVFTKGESIYRCRTCGLDDTCVLCSKCFRATGGHHGHDTSVSVTSVGGGCCDCGDDEAWKVSLNCELHKETVSATEQLQELPVDLILGIESTIPAIFDQILTAFARAPEDWKLWPTAKIKKDLQLTSEEVKEHVAAEEEYCCILWNDESHSFNEVIEQVSVASGVSKERAKEIAEKVDSHGRAIVEQSTSLARLEAVAKKIAQISLNVTVRNSHATRREERAGLFLKFLADICTGRQLHFSELYNGKLLSKIRETACKELETDWIADESNWFQEEVNDSDIEFSEVLGEESRYLEGSLQEYRAEESHTEALQAKENWDSSEGFKQMDEWRERQNLKKMKMETEEDECGLNELRSGKGKQRVDYLLKFDLKLWKTARENLRQVFVATLLASPECKLRLGARFARDYNALSSAFLSVDRAPEHSILLFSVQLLTTPSIATHVVHHHKFLTILLTLLKLHFLPSSTAGDSDPRTKILSCDGIAFQNRRYFQLFHDLHYLLNAPGVRLQVPGNPKYLTQFADLIGLFQGMNPQKRAQLEHVEYENEIWVNAFNVTLQVAKSIREFSACWKDLTGASGIRTIIVSLRWLVLQLETWALSQEKMNIGEEMIVDEGNCFYEVDIDGWNISLMRYDVATSPVSFHHPLHWLFADLLSYTGWIGEQELTDMSWPADPFSNIFGEDSVLRTEKMLRIFDYPLRVCVMIAQIRAGVWVRNGFSIRSQAHHYRDISLREDTYDQDVFLIQVASIVFSPVQFLGWLLNRFGLLGWIDSSYNSEINSVYDKSQITFIVEELLHLLILCVSERSRIERFTVEQEMEREIIHACVQPLSYSEIVRRVPGRIAESSGFDDCLRRLATFKPPDGMLDHGVYELKEDYEGRVDQYFIHYTRNQRAEVEEILRERGKKRGESWFSSPRPNKIRGGLYHGMGSWIQHPVCCRLLFYTLWNIRTKKDEADKTTSSDLLVDETLHLILLGLTDEDNKASNGDAKGMTFLIRNIISLEFGSQLDAPGLTLLDLLLELVDNDDHKECHLKARYVLNMIEEQGGESAKQAIRSHREQCERARSLTPAGDNASLPTTDLERKRKAARELQAKIMNDFAQAQAKFLQNHETLMDEVDDDEDAEREGDENETFHSATESVDIDPNEATRWTYPGGDCIVCQEELERSSIYGMLGLVQPSSLQKYTPLGETQFVTDVFRAPDSLDTQEPEAAEGIEETLQNIRPSLPRKSFGPGLYISTCGHLMHLKCFDSYITSIASRHNSQGTRNHPENILRKEYLCPLCKSLGNTLIPMIGREDRDRIPKLETELENWLESAIPQAKELCGMSVICNTSEDRGISDEEEVLNVPSAPLLGTTAEGYATRVNRPEANVGLERIRESLASFIGEFIRPREDELAERENNSARLIAAELLRVFGGQLATPDIEGIVRIYQKFSRSLRSVWRFADMAWANGIYNSSDLYPVDLMVEMYSRTVACVEISLRGLAVEDGSRGVLSVLSEHSLLLLQVLAESAATYTRFANLNSIVERQFKDRMANYFRLVFPELNSRPPESLLQQDLFCLLNEFSMYAIPILNLDFFHVVHVLFAAEITRIVTALIEEILSAKDEGARTPWDYPEIQFYSSDYPASDIQDTERLFRLIMERHLIEKENVSYILSKMSGSQQCKILRQFCLPFLRRTIILARTRFGIFFPQKEHSPVDEFSFLSSELRLPSLSELVSTIERGGLLGRILSHWCVQHDIITLRKLTPEQEEEVASIMRHGKQWPQSYAGSRHCDTIKLHHPTIYKLISLPQKLDVLLEQTLRKPCSKCGQVPGEPAICLICGTLVCSQSFCCSEEEYGECNLHSRSCGAGVGIFMMIRKCVLLLLHRDNGSFVNPPYLDAHGEADLGLKRGKPQYLNQRRWAEIRKIWLQHAVPIHVARKIELTFDIGGWTTL